jgi:glycerol-3-phosphate O-acyltransferase
MLRNYDSLRDRDIVFIPVGINYDRTLEDRSLLRTLDPEAPKRSSWFAIRTTLKFIRRSLILMALSRWQRFGYAWVNFGPRISMHEYCHKADIDLSRMARDDRFSEIEKLADRLMTDIKKILPVLPISLVATVIKEYGSRGLSAFEVENRVNRLIAQLQANDAPVYVTTRSRVETILNALELLRIRRLVVESEGVYRAAPGEDDILTYYANSIAHWLSSNQVRR